MIEDPNLIVGLENADDAGVYKITEEIAIIQTVDFFTPIVDDPYIYGQIAAANALSDVYAMGGKPITAMSVAGFPIKTVDMEILQDILKGSLDKLREAEVVLVGGHSVDDNELKYGLSVTGIIHPDKVFTNDGAKIGDKLILTKPLGTGIINTALKAEMASEKAISETIKSMSTLNKTASEVMIEMGANACTDITGFGLVGHASEMMLASQVGMIIYSNSVPLFTEVKEYAQMGLVPAGSYANKDYCKPYVEIKPKIPAPLLDVLFDAQTSGGLLISVSAEKSKQILLKLHNHGVKEASIIGEVIKEPKGKIVISS